LPSYRRGRLPVITTHSNPVRFDSRLALYERFRRRMLETGDVHLVTVELAYGDAPFRTRHHHHGHENAHHHGHGPLVIHGERETFVGVRAPDGDELWHKECLVNIGAKHIPDPDWRRMAFIDADIEFHNGRWVEETVERLGLFKVVQLFSDVQDLGPHGERVGPPRTGFAYSWWHKLEPQNGKYNDPWWHPGFAWAYTREAYDAVGGLLDEAILGSGDWHMAMGLIDKAQDTLRPGLSPAYRSMVLAWQRRAHHYLRSDLNYVPGLVTHWWHGKKRDRGYQDRWQILIRGEFNPTTDLVRDHRQDGLLEWSHDHDPRMQRLRDDVRRYLRSRNEDSVDVA
jgi:hypothetical protein